MKNTFCILLFSVLVLPMSIAQTQNKKLRVWCITEYIDGYVITAVDSVKADTLNIISEKASTKGTQTLEKIIVGKEYDFAYEDHVANMASMPSTNFVIRIKNTVVWKSTDDFKNHPVFSRNLIDLWIKKTKE